MARLIPPPPTNGQQGGAAASTLARDAFGREIGGGPAYGSQPAQQPVFGEPSDEKPKEKAVDALGRRAGNLADEIDFPAFVASLVHGTFDAIVDSSIRQTESFAELVSAVSKPLDQFTQENVTEGQTRGWLVEQHPNDLTLVDDGTGGFKLAPRGGSSDDFDAPELPLMAEYGLAGQPADSDTLEGEVLPKARERMAQQRLSTLASMVLMGMQRVVVKDGTIDTRMRFRAAARDRAAVDFATGGDPESGQTQWGARGSQKASVKVATVDVNAQSDTQLAAEIHGKVTINFASDYVPLERFVDEAQRTLLERHSRRPEMQQNAARVIAQTPAPAPVNTQPVAPAPAVTQPAPQPVQAVTPAPTPAPAPTTAPAPPPAAPAQTPEVGQ